MNDLRINDICVCYISWETGGKVRPALIIRTAKKVYEVYKITSSKGHSNVTKAHRYAIKLWQEAGLDKQSYIDFSQRIELSRMFLTFRQIGHLQLEDQAGLRESMKNYIEHYLNN